MIYWMITLVFALMVVIGQAAGVVGAAVSALAFFTALFLFSAMKLGYRQAWTRFALDRFFDPVLKRETWDRLLPIFEDFQVVFIAATVAVAVVAMWLTLPADVVVAVICVVAGFAVLDAFRVGKQARNQLALAAPKRSYLEAAE
jgi:hypothetical protein